MIRRSQKKGNRRLRKASSLHHLEVKMRRDPLQHQRLQKINKILRSFLIAILLVAGTYFGGRALLDKFFFHNPDYNIQELELSLNEVLTPTELQSFLKIHQGMNIFQVDLTATEKKLSDLPEVKKAHVERLLPHTIRITLERRLPIFRLAASSEEPFVVGQSYVVDQEGVLMMPKKTEDALLELPLLIGLESAHFAPGVTLQDEKFSFALTLWKQFNDPKNAGLISIRSFDVSREYDAVVTDGNHACFIFGPDHLPEQMERLQKLLTHIQESGRQIATANLMLEHNTPVTFRSNGDVGSSRLAAKK